MTFTLATTLVDGSATPVVVVDGRHHRLSEVAPGLVSREAGLLSVLRDWEEAEPILVEAVARIRSGASSVPETPAPARLEDWLTPLRFPAKVICTGLNYLEHATKDGGRTSYSKENNVPVFFMKPPTTTLVGQGRSVRYPTQSSQLDYEGELAVVIGKQGRHIQETEALDHVAGYAVALDLSARDWQRHPRHLVQFDLFGGKVFDDSCPLGPGIVPARFIDHTDLRLRLWVNGELRQDATTADMIWSVPELIARISEHVTLEPGDVILTGTPSGVGLATSTWLETGDVVRCEVGDIGAVEVQIVGEQDQHDGSMG
jgi:2-keto-4-pentenoate hydratase/2-oxohepta-3-ene-1,7-dioic acid hydratase in catechol pathway